MQSRINCKKAVREVYMRMELAYDMAYLHTETSTSWMLSNALAYPLQRKQLKNRGSLCREILKATF